jgi:AcrR family transcriptional regulator
MSATRRSMRADARRSHDAIPAAAGDLFAGRGSEVQMDEIAGRAGVGIGTMCRHFAAKQALGGDAAPVAVQAEVDAGTRSGVRPRLSSPGSSTPQPLIMGFIDTMRAQGHAVPSQLKPF